jgi:DNA-binding response OmpR family regulator
MKHASGSRILVVEDETHIAEGLRLNLSLQGHAVRIARDGSAALHSWRQWHPQLIVLDLMLPGIDGYEVAERLRAKDRETGIIMVTALDTERDKVRGLDAGADDYITKPFSMEELLARVRANLRRVRARETLAADTALEKGDLVIEPKSFKLTVAGTPVKLRLKEFQLLLALARRDGELCTRQMLAEEVWGYEHLASSRTIDVHIRRLRQAVETPSAFIYIHTVHGMGYRFEVTRRDQLA